MPRKYIPKAKPKPAAAKETDLSREIKTALELLPRVACLWRNQSGTVAVRRGYMHLSPAGTPDLIGYCTHGRMIAVEVKTPTGKVSPDQELWRQRAVPRSVHAFVARSEEEAVKEFLRHCTATCGLTDNAVQAKHEANHILRTAQWRRDRAVDMGRLVSSNDIPDPF